MLVVADTSALVALAACQQLHLLEVLFDEIRVPPAVHRECTVPGKPEATALSEYLSGKVAEVALSEFVIAVAGLGQGELEAMALYRKLSADELLLDDQRARKVARFNGMRVIGSVGVLLAAKQRGHIQVLRPLLETIRRSGIHISDALVTEALRLAGES
ncbi:DUF3368 domain-containing protein [Archangium sp.]|jgi:hypothetical protein|uniref:DUF3368 domain-containing protein n=1 Tax=Archangium sp. TaxID=1872627 RepID=UPI002ED959EC